MLATHQRHPGPTTPRQPALARAGAEENPRCCVLHGVTDHPRPLFLPLLRRLPRLRRGTHVPATSLGPGALPHAEHFAEPVCRNCGAALAARYCGDCGQEKATRFGLRSVGREAWQAWRWFELDVLRSAWRLLSAPGHVAREYVLGARKRHVHPLKLLLFAAGLLLLVLSQANFLSSTEAGSSEAFAQVKAWSNWSFSFAIVAMFVATWLCFRGRGYNATELVVLGVYVQFLVLCVAIANHLPTLVWRDPDFLGAHAAWSPWLMNAVGATLLVRAAMQFFGLQWRFDAPRLLLVATLYLGLRWLLLRAYGQLIVAVVLGFSP